MQYELTLPADYDMTVIERRVAERGSATDAFPHLGLKAYAVRRIGRHGSPVNAYAPFYLWHDPAGMNAFLYGPFRAIVTDFGRPAVRHWVGAAFHRGPAFGEQPVFLTRRRVPLPADVLPGDALDGQLEPPAARAGLHSEAVAVDPDRWELLRVTLWTAAPARPDPGVTGFDVLHASTPHLERLATGRLW
ncbi:DUF4865 family protein [Actinoplanes sp. URMC 104]|uniref:DUF4865 family protein n=1 Tax=Actinoplanes sp. URMC 104 TaxID=3423409 RepID=UPI003F1D06B1